MTCTDTPDQLLLIARKKDIRMRQLVTGNASAANAPPAIADMVIPLDGLK